MNVETFSSFLGWCLIINIGILLYWTLILVFAPDWLHGLTEKWITITKERLLTIHYVLLGGFKIALVFFNLVPYLALELIT